MHVGVPVVGPGLELAPLGAAEEAGGELLLELLLVALHGAGEVLVLVPAAGPVAVVAVVPERQHLAHLVLERLAHERLHRVPVVLGHELVHRVPERRLRQDLERLRRQELLDQLLDLDLGEVDVRERFLRDVLRLFRLCCGLRRTVSGLRLYNEQERWEGRKNEGK